VSTTACALLTVAIAGVLAWLLTPPSGKVGLKLGLADLPSSRRVRARAVPTTGGIVVFLAFAVAMVVAARLCTNAPPELGVKLRALLIGATAVVVLGMADDRMNLRPLFKLIAQTIIAVAMVASGVGIDHMRFVLGPTISLGWLGYPLSVLWFLAFMNSLNMIDGLDGLAGGIAAITAGGLFAVSVLDPNPILFLMGAGLFGATTGFLFHNYGRGNVYLGDAGSMTLGFLLAGGSIIGARQDAASTTLLVAAACMTVPAFDVTTSMYRRWRKGQHIMKADRGHVHHRLIRFGLSPRHAVLVLWAATVFFGGQMLALVTPHGLIYVLASYVALGIVGRILLNQRRKNLRTTERDIRDEFFYLIGAKDTFGDEEGGEEEPGLRGMIVEQIRREALFRRLERNERVAGSRRYAPPAGDGPEAPDPAVDDGADDDEGAEAEAVLGKKRD
jgi:UDP-GlcNAc:undecaprenyl-phosphate GlcNAc-1-phosphate transferase